MKNLIMTSKSISFFPLAAFGAVAALSIACASTAPNPKVETSSAAIRAAEEVGGAHTPEAALHLQLAKEEFEFAQHLSNPGDKSRVDGLLMRSQADAELSLALARSEAEKAEAQGAIEKVKTLKKTATQ